MATEQEEQETTGVIKTSVSLPVYLFNWIKELVHENKFHSQSAVMVAALAEMKGRMEARDEIAKTQLETSIEIKNKRRDDGYVAFILTLFSQHPELLREHPELIGELNNLIREIPDDKYNVKQVTID